jgi:translation initiation factor 1
MGFVGRLTHPHNTGIHLKRLINMSKKHKADTKGFVFSTDPHFRFEKEDNTPPATLPPAKQKLKLWLDTKQRAGKAVTLITGFIGTDEDLEQLGKDVKNYCGTGGSVKNGEIIIQGNQMEKVKQYLQKNAYTVK